MHSIKKLIIEDKIISIESRAYILNGNIQTVYKYFINNILVLTFYTNGKTTQLYPIYNEINIWPKKKLDALLSEFLPI